MHEVATASLWPTKSKSQREHYCVVDLGGRIHAYAHADYLESVRSVYIRPKPWGANGRGCSSCQSIN